MNYFELFGLPIGFQVDTQKLRAAFMEIQKATHPDKFAQGDPEEQEAALEQSSLANKGYTLLNQKERILPYVLEILGIMTPDEKYALEPDFLMEMMELMFWEQKSVFSVLIRCPLPLWIQSKSVKHSPQICRPKRLQAV